jgi:hypothetical protein
MQDLVPPGLSTRGRLGLGQRRESRFIGLVEGLAVFSNLIMVGRLNASNPKLFKLETISICSTA